MAWQDNLKTCTYTSPSGVFFTLQYEDVARAAKKKTTVFEFIGTSDVLVQDNNVGAKTYPLTIYFTGDDHDTQANDFFEALSEVGAGQLQHPFYGLLTVNPVGDIKRSDKLKSGANQSAFEIKFVETIVNLYPASQSNQKSNAIDASENFDNDIAEEFDDQISVATESEKQALIEDSTDHLATFKSGLDGLAADQADLQKKLNDTFDSINNSIDILIGDPLTLAFQTGQMIKTVTNSVALIGDRLQSYGNLLNDIIKPDNTVNKTYDSVGSNKLATQDLYAATALSAMNDCVTQTEFKTRDEALNAAILVSDNFYDYMDWKERNYQSVGVVDTGNAYQQLQNQTAIGASLIIDVSLSLKRQRSIVLDRNMFVIDFAYKYFGTTDNTAVEEVITLNGLDNSEIWTIPRGRVMAYYVE